jgi:hypothetical protein
MNYAELLTRALAISWRHRYLWLLALLSGEGAMSGLQSVQGPPGRQNGASPQLGSGGPSELTAWLGAHAALLWGAAIAFALVLIVLLLVSAVANGAVVRAAAEHDGERPFGLRSAWRAGIETFWPVLRIKLLAIAVVLATLVAVGSLALLAFAAGRAGNAGLAIAGGAGAGLLFLLAIPFWIVFSVAVLLAVREIVLDGKRPLAALGGAFGLIRRRLGRVALVWLLVIVCGLLGGAVVAVAAVIVALPLAAITVGSYVAGGIGVAIGVGAFLVAVWAVIALTLSAAVDAFISTMWTLAYARLDIDPEPVPAGIPAPA